MNPGTAALERGLEVLCALAEEPAARDGLGVVALAGLVGGDKSQLSRTLRTLEEHGFVERDRETLAYRLSWRLFAVAARVGESQLVAAAPPVLRELVRELGESVHLSVRVRRPARGLGAARGRSGGHALRGHRRPPRRRGGLRFTVLVRRAPGRRPRPCGRPRRGGGGRARRRRRRDRSCG